MRPFSIVLFAVSAVLAVYSAAVRSGGTKYIRYMDRVSVKDKKAYADFFAKAVLLVALAPLAGGIAGLIAGDLAAFIVLVAGMVASLVCISKRSKNIY